MTYFHMGNPHYHRRKVVSLSCSGWEGVGPTRYVRQANLLNNLSIIRILFALTKLEEVNIVLIALL